MCQDGYCPKILELLNVNVSGFDTSKCSAAQGDSSLSCSKSVTFTTLCPQQSYLTKKDATKRRLVRNESEGKTGSMAGRPSARTRGCSLRQGRTSARRQSGFKDKPQSSATPLGIFLHQDL